MTAYETTIATGNKVCLEILVDLRVFSCSAYEKMGFGIPSVCLFCLCIYVLTYVPPEQLDGFYSYSLFLSW
jgi:hypothetical protein